MADDKRVIKVTDKEHQSRPAEDAELKQRRADIETWQKGATDYDLAMWDIFDYIYNQQLYENYGNNVTHDNEGFVRMPADALDRLVTDLSSEVITEEVGIGDDNKIIRSPVEKPVKKGSDNKDNSPRTYRGFYDPAIVNKLGKKPDADMIKKWIADTGLAMRENLISSGGKGEENLSDDELREKLYTNANINPETGLTPDEEDAQEKEQEKLKKQSETDGPNGSRDDGHEATGSNSDGQSGADGRDTAKAAAAEKDGPRAPTDWEVAGIDPAILSRMNVVSKVLEMTYRDNILIQSFGGPANYLSNPKRSTRESRKLAKEMRQLQAETQRTFNYATDVHNRMGMAVAKMVEDKNKMTIKEYPAEQSDKPGPKPEKDSVLAHMRARLGRKSVSEEPNASNEPSSEKGNDAVPSEDRRAAGAGKFNIAIRLGGIKGLSGRIRGSVGQAIEDNKARKAAGKADQASAEEVYGDVILDEHEETPPPFGSKFKAMFSSVSASIRQHLPGSWKSKAADKPDAGKDLDGYDEEPNTEEQPETDKKPETADKGLSGLEGYDEQDTPAPPEEPTAPEPVEEAAQPITDDGPEVPADDDDEDEIPDPDARAAADAVLAELDDDDEDEMPDPDAVAAADDALAELDGYDEQPKKENGPKSEVAVETDEIAERLAKNAAAVAGTSSRPGPAPRSAAMQRMINEKNVGEDDVFGEGDGPDVK